MRKVNCRNTDQCLFCKYWHGSDPKMNYRTGECHYNVEIGQCLRKNASCDSEHICGSYQKKLLYM